MDDTGEHATAQLRAPYVSAKVKALGAVLGALEVLDDGDKEDVLLAVAALHSLRIQYDSSND